MFKQFAVAAVLAVASSAACSQHVSPFYAGVDVGSTKFRGVSETGVGGFVGYTIKHNLAIEASHHRVRTFKLSERYDSAYDEFDVDYAGSSKLQQSAVSLVLALPLSEGFGFYSRLGVNHLKTDIHVTSVYSDRTETEARTSSENKVLYGAGLSYAFSPALVGRVEVQKPYSTLTKLAVGVSYGF